MGASGTTEKDDSIDSGGRKKGSQSFGISSKKTTNGNDVDGGGKGRGGAKTGGSKLPPHLPRPATTGIAKSSFGGTADDVGGSGRGSGGNNDDDGALRVLSETLAYELRAMKEEICALREELRMLGPSSSYPSASSSSSSDAELNGPRRTEVEEYEREERTRMAKLRREERKRRLERVGMDVERWAADLLSERDDDSGGGDGAVGDRSWREISCNNFVRKKFNRNGNTRVYLKVRSIHVVVRLSFLFPRASPR